MGPRPGLPPAIEPQRLSVFMLGPGAGESIVVHAPPGEWLVVDGCTIRGRSAPLAILERYGVRRLRALAVTHPHEDHARGILEILGTELDVEVLGCVDCWSSQPGLDEIWREPPAASFADQDPDVAVRRGAARHILAAIRRTWLERPQSRWLLHQGERLVLGDAIVRVLSPNDAELSLARTKRAEGRSFSANRLSSAMSVEVGSTQVTLGADLPYRERRRVIVGGGWEQVPRGGSWPRLPDTDLLKAPHHGSRDALPERLLGPRRKTRHLRVAVAPFSPDGLPDPRDDHGLDILLRNAPEVDVTALDGTLPRRIRRADLARRMNTSLPGAPKQIRWAPCPRPAAPEDACVTMILDREGNIVERWHGSLAGLVVS